MKLTTVVFPALFACLACSAAEPAKPKVAAPDFTLTSLDGARVSPSRYRGKPVIVHFFTTWCPPCREEMPSLQRFAQWSGADILVISDMEKEDAVRKFVQDAAADGAPFVTPVLTDPQGTVSGAYGVTGYPETLFVDEEGYITRRVLGPMDWPERR